MIKEDCIFCKIINNQINSFTIFENSECKVVLDAFPATIGHILIIPKTHVDDVFHIEPELAGSLFSLATLIAKIMKKEFNLEGMNILQNNGSIAGQTVMHFHIHLIPRYKDDNIKIHWDNLNIQEDQFKSMVQQISAYFR